MDTGVEKDKVALNSTTEIEHRRSLKGSLAKHTTVRVAPGQEWDEARDTAWNEVAKQKVGGE